MSSVQDAAFLQSIIPHFNKLLKNERSLFLKEYNITPVQYDVLHYLLQKNQYLSALSELVQLDSSTLVGVIDRLEKREFIIKKVSPKDRRMNIISITESGKKALTDIPPFVSPSLRAILEELHPDKQRQLAELLSHIIEKLEITDPAFHIREAAAGPLVPASVL